MVNVHAENLVRLWIQNAIGAKEDFDLMIIDFLETLQDNVSIYEVLNDARIIAIEKMSVNFSDDIALKLSHGAFNTSLEYQLQFWKTMVEGQ